MEILVILLLILLNGLFAMSEIALISARRSNLEMQARQGSAGARQALKLAKDPDRFLSTVQIGITLIGILTGIYSGDTLAAKFGGRLLAAMEKRHEFDMAPAGAQTRRLLGQTMEFLHECL